MNDKTRPIRSGGTVSGLFRVPGSKSLTNRALVCAALADGVSRIENASDSDDTGLMANGLGYLKHLCGPNWLLAPVIFTIEVISLCVRPVTLSVRLMLNMSVDHLILGIMMGLVAIFIPIPVQFLGIIIIVVQTLVFALLTTIYIGLATAHEDEH